MRSLAAVAALPSSEPLDHELRARQAVVRLGLEGLDELDVTTLVEQAFVRVPAGGVDLYMTAGALTKPGAPERLLEVAAGVLRAQSTLIQWTEPDARRQRDLQKPIQAEVKLLGKSKGKALARALEDGVAGQLADRLDWREDAREGAAAVSSMLARGELLGVDRGAQPLPVLLAWDRNEFADLLALAGTDPTARPFLWVDGTESWTHFFVQEARVWSLVNPDGSSMTVRIDRA